MMPQVECSIASLYGIDELKDMMAGREIVIHVTGESITVAIYTVRVATKSLNDIGSDEEQSLIRADYAA